MNEAQEANRGPTETDAVGVPHRFVFGEFVLEPGQGTLSRCGERMAIQRKPMHVLTHLVDRAPALVSREELLGRFWSTAVNDEALTRCISTLRKLLDDTEDVPRFIETQRARGYRFISPVDRRSGLAVQERSPAEAIGFGWFRLASVVGLFALLLVAGLFLARLERGPDSIGSSMIDRIVVLPITVPADAEGWLAPAMTDHLMRAVSPIEGITVVAYGAGPVAVPAVDVRELARRLDAQAVLESRLERVADGSRLVARLTAAKDGRLLWTASVRSPHELGRGDQVEAVARRVATRLRPSLQLRETAVPVDPEAYRDYLRGRFHWQQRSRESLEAAISSFESALAKDPGFTDALVGAAESWLLLPLYGAEPPNIAMPRARELASRALKGTASDHRAIAVLGMVAMQYDWNWSEAESLLRRAVALNPNDATAQQWLGELCCYRSRFAECRERLSLALDLDPLSPVLRMLRGSPDLWAHRFEEARIEYARGLEEYPGFPMGRYFLGLTLAGLERWPEAVAAYETALPELGLSIVGGPLVYALARAGRIEAAQAHLDSLVRLGRERYVPPTKLAIAYLGLGLVEEAHDALEHAFQVHDDRLVYVGVDAHFSQLLENPTFIALSSRYGFGWHPATTARSSER